MRLTIDEWIALKTPLALALALWILAPNLVFPSGAMSFCGGFAKASENTDMMIQRKAILDDGSHSIREDFSYFTGPPAREYIFEKKSMNKIAA